MHKILAILLLSTFLPILEGLPAARQDAFIHPSAHPYPLIVKLKQSESVAQVVKQHMDQLVEEGRAQLHHTYDFEGFTGYSASFASTEDVETLRNQAEVEYVEADLPCHIATTQRDATWNLARLNHRQPTTRTEYRYDDNAGKGVTIYVLDTGVYVEHVEFRNRAQFGASFKKEARGDGETDPNGHGTHVAGVAAGTVLGVAKAANIIDVQVLKADGSGSWSDVLAGLQWYNFSKKGSNNAPAMYAFHPCGRSVRRARSTVRQGNVINISISGPKSRALNDAIENAIQAGIHVVVAAGNFATNACDQSPASAVSAMTVGSMGASDYISYFSNTGLCVDLFAPGEGILSAYIGGPGNTAWLSGTSMAAPHVSGVKALYLARRFYSPAELDGILKRSATPELIKGIPDKTANLLLHVTEKLGFGRSPSAPLPTSDQNEE